MDGADVNLRRDLAVGRPERIRSGRHNQQYQYQKYVGAGLP
jgi:hypothetical protein